MKKFFWLGVLAVMALPISAESVSSVSFNPSRLGNYDYLKVSESAKLPGGLRTPQLNIRGTVTLQNQDSASFKVDAIEARYRNTVSFPNAEIALSTTTLDSSLISGQETPTPTTLYIRGGKLDFSSQEGGHIFGGLGDTPRSYLDKLIAEHNLLQYANTLDVTNNLSVLLPSNDGGSSNIQLVDSALDRSSAVAGFMLGETNILSPDKVYYRASENVDTGLDTHYYSSLDLSNPNCTLKWVPRKISGQDATVLVLALDNCEPSCKEEVHANITVTRNCDDAAVQDNATKPWVWTQGFATAPARKVTTCEKGADGKYISSDEMLLYIKSGGGLTDEPKEAWWDRSQCYKYGWQKGATESIRGPAHMHFLLEAAVCRCNILDHIDFYADILEIFIEAFGGNPTREWKLEDQDVCGTLNEGEIETDFNWGESVNKDADDANFNHHSYDGKIDLWEFRYCKVFKTPYTCSKIYSPEGRPNYDGSGCGG